MALPDATPLILRFTRSTRGALAAYPVVRAKAAVASSMAIILFYRGSVESLYDILWAVTHRSREARLRESGGPNQQ